MTPEQIGNVLRTAVRAPSVHNTQPWRFSTPATPGGDVLEVHADRGRLLREQDPTGRELLLSCGAATAYAELAVRGEGLGCDVQWLPDPADPDLVARVTVAGARPAQDPELRLLQAVPLRHTDRSAFAATPVPQEVVDTLVRAAEHTGATVVAEQQPDRVLTLEVLVARADQVLRADPALRAELAGWVRDGDRPAEGLPVHALPDHGLGRGSSLALRDFAPSGVLLAPAPDEPPAAEHPLLLLLETAGDGPEDWLRAGAGLARVLLAATAEGLVANPQTQVLEVPGLRERLVQELGLTGRPQMLLRVGYPVGPGSARTGRRPVADVLDAAPGSGPA